MSSRVLSSSDVSRQRSRDAGLKQAPGAPASRRESYSHDDNKSMNGADGEPSELKRRQRNLQGSTDDLLKPTIVIKVRGTENAYHTSRLRRITRTSRANLIQTAPSGQFSNAAADAPSIDASASREPAAVEPRSFRPSRRFSALSIL